MTSLLVETTPDQLEDALAAATAAAGEFAELTPEQRAILLEAVATALEGAADVLIPIAQRETHLTEGRLRSELTRTTYQLRHFATVLADGAFLDATIDHADPDWVLGPLPDVRRVNQSLGPVLVFAAGNFPFAFSVCGGDTASALAAGCPVILKTHPGHPELSHRTAEVVVAALLAAGAPAGIFSVISGVEVGRRALLDPRITAGAFTGSTAGGRALFDLACSRPTPIPFYGELGSLNPTFVTPGAVRSRGASLIEGYVASYTLGVGQFCTKPGLLFLPAGHGLTDGLVAAVRAVAPAELLDERIGAGYDGSLESLRRRPGVRVLVGGEASGPVTPTLLATTVPELLRDRDSLLEECFGPTSVVVEYADDDELYAAAEVFEGTLTVTVHAEADEAELTGRLLGRLRERAGRIVWNGWPTGVAVTWAMHHGGPYPSSTTPSYTSVGSAAIGRFLRPVCFQDVPQDLLPLALKDDNPLGVPRRVNGSLDRADSA
jgi:NADP-dependent aldehyde dehydrogenase